MAQATSSELSPAVRREPDRNLALDLLRVTEAAAMAAGRWVGRRDKDGADAAAVAAMLTVDDLVSGDDAFFVMTGITDGELLHGVRYGRDRAVTDSLVMRPRSGTIRQVRSTHHLDRLARYSTVDYRHATGGRGPESTA